MMVIWEGAACHIGRSMVFAEESMYLKVVTDRDWTRCLCGHMGMQHGTSAVDCIGVAETAGIVS